MKTFEFEIQSLIKVEIVADYIEEARGVLLASLEEYELKLMENSCLSDGVEVKK